MMVELKSYKNGIVVRMNPESSLETLKSEVAEKFREATDFFGDARIAVSFSGKEITLEEEFMLARVIEENSRVRVICVTGMDEGSERLFGKALEKAEFEIENFAFLHADVKRGSVRKGERVSSSHSLVVLGDIEKGSSIEIDGDLYCFGTLSGAVSAGNDMLEGHRVIALSFSPEYLQISGVIYVPGREKTKGLGFRTQKGPRIARTGIGGKIIVSPLTRQILDSLELEE
ncbi:MAG: hypothetical protein K6E33_08025 [Lachnospiraceae bacterium]|nr:hypothetical protein [Lachnospiraceae bacterium]